MLVFSQGTLVVGLAVDSILDIVEDVLDFQLTDQSSGVLGTAVLKGRSTEIIDVSHLSQPGRAELGCGGGAARHSRQSQAYPADRSSSLLPQPPRADGLRPAGYDVTVASGLEEARARLAAGATFDVVLADADGAPITEVQATRSSRCPTVATLTQFPSPIATRCWTPSSALSTRGEAA